MAGLYAIMENGTREQASLIWPSLSKSRESFSTTLVLTNAFYLTQTREIAEEILKNLDAIEGTIPVMLDLADNDLQRGALGALAYRIVSLAARRRQSDRALHRPARICCAKRSTATSR